MIAALLHTGAHTGTFAKRFVRPRTGGDVVARRGGRHREVRPS